jgi:hypothetical protein
MRTQSILFLLGSFLLSCGFTMPAMACPPPDCGACCHWVPPSGSSEGYCTLNEGAHCGDCAPCFPCNTCVSCSCEWDCTPGQCCDDGERVTTCPECKSCVSQVCEDDTVASVSADKDEACVGCDITFTATTSPTGLEDDVSWSGGGSPSTGTGATFTTSWDTIGTKTVTASLCDSSVSEDVTIAEVASVTADKDDACVNENITFTVTTNPAGHYDLVSWSGGGTPASQEGGQTFTTQWSTCDTQTVTATCGSSSKSKSVTIKGLAPIIPSEPEVCNGEDLLFTATTCPTGFEEYVTWSGGGTPATGTGPFFFTKWTTGSSGARTVTASYCNDSKSKSVNLLFGCDCDRPGDTDTLYAGFGCPPLCSGTNTETEPDNCSNILKIQCGPSGFCYYRYFYNSTQVGRCPYPDGVNWFRYTKTINDDRFYSTWHRSRDPYNDGSDADQGTKHKYDWVVWIYNCIDDIGPDPHWREHPTSWGDENFGDPSPPD